MSWSESKNVLYKFLWGALGAIVVLAAFWLRQFLDAYFGIVLPPYITFYPAVMFIAMRGGIWLGVFSTTFSALLTDYFILKPAGSWRVTERSDAVALAMFCGICVAICIIAERLRRNERRLAVLQKDEELRAVMDKLDMALQCSPDAIFISDTEGNFLQFNDAFATYHRFPSKEECAKTLSAYPEFFDVCFSNEQPAPLEMWAVPRALRGETAVNAEYKLRRKDTGESWIGSYNFSPVRDKDGTIVGSVVIARDVTEQKHAVAALAKSEARFRRLFEDNGSIFLLIEPMSGQIMDANHAASAFYGYSREQLRSMLITQINVLGETALITHRQRVLNGETDCFNWVHRLSSGQERQVECFSSPVENNGRKVLFSVVRDVTEVRRTESQLRLSEERYRTAFQTSLDAILITRMVDGKILDANQSFLEITGHRKEVILGRTTLELAMWANQEDRDKLVRLMRERTTCRDLEAQFQRQSGELFWGIMSASPLEIDGEACALEVMRDISAAKQAADELGASEERYRTAFRTSLDAILITEVESGRIVDSNTEFQKTLGCSQQDLHNMTTAELRLWVDAGNREEMVRRLSETGTFRDFEFRFRRRDGVVRWGLMSASEIEIAKRPCILSVLRDVTESKAAVEGLRASEERYRTAFQTSIDAIAITRIRDGAYIDVNRRFRDITGYEREEVLGKTSVEIGVWVDQHDRDSLIDSINDHWSCRDFQTRFRKKNGDLIWSLISVSRIEVDGESCIMSIIRDVSEAKQAEEQIRNLVFFDPLTGLANRRLLLERLRQHPGFEGTKIRYRALLFLDLDDFRMLNDSMGHQAGDLVLREVGMRLASSLRTAGTIARTGGDEFVVLLEDLGENAEEGAAQAGGVADTILERTARPIQLEQREWNLSCCIGIAVFGGNRENATQALQQADIAMTQAKNAGRGSVRFFAPELQAAVDARAEMEDELRQGLRNGEFLLYFQPQVQAGTVIGAEALLRWQHPRRGLLHPGMFIQLAEETHLIHPLGEWVLETACRQIRQWAESSRTIGLQLAVNVSALEVRKPDFVQRVLAVLERTGANPGSLELEITETILMENVEDTIIKMQALKAHGLRFSIDDFGTGYSSLAYLKRFPIDQLKIDISFVRDILVDESSSVIARTIISLGQAMGLSVIAEGVESEPQREHLAGLGCYTYQGFLFSHPLPVEEFERLLL